MKEILSELLDPVLVLSLMGLFLLAVVWRRRTSTTSGRFLVFALLYLVVMASCTPLGSYFINQRLEQKFPKVESRPEDIDAIVVLGGALVPKADRNEIGEVGIDSMRRCVRAASLYHEGKPCPVIVSGGNLNMDRTNRSLAEAMQQFLIRMGVSKDDIVLEDQSLTTLENASYSCKLLTDRGAKRVAIVSDATHLWRAEQSFRKQSTSIDFVLCGTYYRAERNPLDSRNPWSAFLPHSRAAEASRAAFHEWVGMAWYAAQ